MNKNSKHSNTIVDVAEINEEHRQRVLELMFKDEVNRFWTCVPCGFQALDKSRIFTHIETKHIREKTANICNYCYKPQASYNALKIHIFRNHREEHRIYKYRMNKKL